MFSGVNDPRKLYREHLTHVKAVGAERACDVLAGSESVGAATTVLLGSGRNVKHWIIGYMPKTRCETLFPK